MGKLRKLKNRLTDLYDLYYEYRLRRIVRWVPTTLVLPLNIDGKMILQVVRNDTDGTLYKKNYQIEHMLDENMQITEETLEMEKKWFEVPVKFQSSDEKREKIIGYCVKEKRK